MAEKGLVDETVLIQFAQKLAGNEKKFRDRALKKLRRFLESKARSTKGAFSEADFLKIWKGLHYCMWMADKPLIQEELANSLASLIKCFKNPEQAFLFIDVFFQTETREWFCIDRLRLDKFMTLIRKVLGGSLELIKLFGWKLKFIKRFNKILSKGVVSANSSTPDGLKFHIADAFMSELERVGASELKPKQLELFLQPFIHLIMQTKSPIMLRHVLKTVFFRIVDYGMENVLQKQKEGAEENGEEENGEEETEEEDPFSESFIPLKIDLNSLAQKLLDMAGSENCHNQNRKDIYSLVKTYQDLAAGILPAEETLEDEEEEDEEEALDYGTAVKRLNKFETKLMKQTGKKRKQKKGEDGQEPAVKKQKQISKEEEEIETRKPKNKFKKDGDKKKKKGMEKIEKKKKLVKEEKPKKKEDMKIFTGGFFYDEDDEDNDGGDDDSAQNGNMETELSDNGTFEEYTDYDHEVSFKITEEKTPVSQKLQKKKDEQKKLKGSQDESISVIKQDGTTEGLTSSTKKKAKRKSLDVANGDSPASSNGNVVTEDAGSPEEKKKKLVKEEKPKKKEDLNIFTGGFFYDEDDEDNDGGDDDSAQNEDMETELAENGTFEEYTDDDHEVSFKITEEKTPVSQKLQKKKDEQKKLKGSQDESISVIQQDGTTEGLTSSTKKKAKSKSLDVANGNSPAISNSNVVTEDAGSPKEKLGKKKKRKSLGDLEERISELKNLKKAKKLERRKSLGGASVQTESAEKVKKKDKQQRRKSLNDQDDGEVEIWVPNKKYTGKLKNWFQEKQKKSLGSSSPYEMAKSEELVSFTAITKTPPAFVRRSLDKASPKSKKSQLSRVDTPLPNAGSGKKRVSFIMSKNDIRALNSNSVLSPLPAFNPDEKPASPIIKLMDSPAPSPSSVNLKRLTKINTVRNTPKSFPVVHLGKIKGRVRAADFF